MTRERAGGVCEVCGKVGSQTSHFFNKKTHAAVRFDPDNLQWLCFTDHIIKIHRQADMEDARAALIKRIGQKRFDALREKAHEIKKWKYIELKEMIDRFKDFKEVPF